jgi:hypothetical protein
MKLLYDNDLIINKEYEYKYKIIRSNFFIENEINIIKIILEKKIPSYENFFYIPKEIKTINIKILLDEFEKKEKIILNSEILLEKALQKRISIEDINYEDINYEDVKDEDILNDLNLTINNDKTYLYSFRNIKNNSLINFIDFINSIETPEKFINFIIYSFKYLLFSLETLNENENPILFLNFNPRNILISEINKCILIYDFKYCICDNSIDYTFSKNFIYKIIENIEEKNNNLIYLPIELHFLYYLIKNDISIFSYSYLDIFIDNYFKKLSILNLFNEKYKNEFKEECYNYISEFLNINSNNIIKILLEKVSKKKWVIYSFSLLYLNIFIKLYKEQFLSNNFIKFIINILIKNINPNPLKRYNINETLELFNYYFENEENWKKI